MTNGQSLTLYDGRTVRLGTIQAPRMATKGMPPEPLAIEARNALRRLTQDHALTFSDPVPDKFSRLRAQVFADTGTTDPPLWVQGEMITQGLARVHTRRDDQARAHQLLALEETARKTRRGIWAQPYYALRTPNNAGAAIGSFQIVQGRIFDVAEVRERIYLNFGEDWRHDFTINIAPKDKRQFTRVGIDLIGLAGAEVRVRGLVRFLNGPIIYLDHAAAFEVL